jgi:hypothetical protein
VYWDEVFVNTYTPGVLGALEHAMSYIYNFECLRLFKSLDYARDWHAKYLAWECQEMRRDNSHNVTAIENRIARLQALHPTFASISYGKLAWVSHYWCALRSLATGKKETECYQDILDNRLGLLKEPLRKAKRAKEVCAEFGVEL